MDVIAFCGNNCSYCPRYLATQSGDPQELHKVAVLWEKCGYRDRVVSNEEISCHGCSITNWCRYDVADCMKDGIANCGKCRKYSCDKIQAAFERTRSFEAKIREACSETEYQQLKKAFYEKKENLDRIAAENAGSNPFHRFLGEGKSIHNCKKDD